MGAKLDNPFAQYVDVENDPIIQPAVTPREQAADARANRTTALQEERFNYQIQRDQMEDRREAEEKAREQKEEAEFAANADETARAKLIATIGKLSQIGLDANDNSGWFETGSTGSIARSIFPSGAAGPTLGRDIQTAEARFAFDALQAMRDASKTGGALGQVTERELDLLKSATANIDPDLGHETFMRNIEEARQAYLSKLAMVDPQAAARLGYDAKQAEAAWTKYNDAYAKELGYDTALPIDRSEGRQSTQPLPDDIQEIMKKYGG